MSYAGKWFQKLTPERAWEQYVGDESIELFISLYHNDGITDLTEMCRDFVKDIPKVTGRLYSQNQLDRIAVLLKQYIDEEGCDETKLYSSKDLDDLWNSGVEAILRLTEKYRKR